MCIIVICSSLVLVPLLSSIGAYRNDLVRLLPYMLRLLRQSSITGAIAYLTMAQLRNCANVRSFVNTLSLMSSVNKLSAVRFGLYCQSVAP
jgi:hypothetical protein